MVRKKSYFMWLRFKNKKFEMLNRIKVIVKLHNKTACVICIHKWLLVRKRKERARFKIRLKSFNKDFNSYFILGIKDGLIFSYTLYILTHINWNIDSAKFCFTLECNWKDIVQQWSGQRNKTVQVYNRICSPGTEFMQIFVF